MNISKFLKIFTVSIFLLSLGDSGHFYAAEAKKAGNKGVIFSSAPPNSQRPNSPPPGFPPGDARYVRPPGKFSPDFRPPDSQRPDFPPPGFQARDARYAPPPGKFPPDFPPQDSQRPDFPPDEFMPPWDVPSEPRGPEVNVETQERPTMVMLDAAKKKGIIIDWEVALAEGNIDNAVMSEFYFRKEDGSVLDETPIAFAPSSYNLIGTAEKSLRAYSFSSSAKFLYQDYYGSPYYYQAKTTYTPDALSVRGYYYEYEYIYLTAENNSFVEFNLTENGIQEVFRTFEIAPVVEDFYNRGLKEIPLKAHSAFGNFCFYAENIGAYAPMNYNNDQVLPIPIRFPVNISPYLVSIETKTDTEWDQTPYYAYEKTTQKLYRLIPDHLIPHSEYDNQLWYSAWSYPDWCTSGGGSASRSQYPGASLDELYQIAKNEALNSIGPCYCDWNYGVDSRYTYTDEYRGDVSVWGRMRVPPITMYNGGGASLKERATINAPIFVFYYMGYQWCTEWDLGECVGGWTPQGTVYWAEDIETFKSGMGNALGPIGSRDDHPPFFYADITSSLGDKPDNFYIGAGDSVYGMQPWNGTNPPLSDSLVEGYQYSVGVHGGTNFYFAYRLGDIYLDIVTGMGDISYHWDANYQYKVDKDIDLKSSSIEAIEYGDRNKFFDDSYGYYGYFNYVGGWKQARSINLFGPFLFDVDGWNLYSSFPLIHFQDAPFFPDFNLTYNSQALWSMVFNTVGRGWTHSYDMFVSPVKDYGDDQYALKRPDGGITAYIKQSGDDFYSSLYGGSSFDNGNRLYEEEFGGEYRYKLLRGNGEAYYFNNWGRLIWIEDINGNKITLEYDKQKLRFIKDSSGRQIELQYTADDMLEKVIAPMQSFAIEHQNPTYITKITNRQTKESYQFGYTDNLVRDYALDELINSYTGPDGVNYQIEYEDPEGWWWNRWDRWNKVKKVTNANRGVYEITWGEWYETDIKDWNGNLTKHEYDGDIGAFTVTDPLGYKTATKFGDFDQVEYFKDKNGNATNYTYTERPDTHAQLLDRIDYPSVDGEAVSESFTYYDDPGGFHWLNIHTDPEGHKTTYNRDLATGFVTSMVDGENKEWKYTPHGTAKGKVASVEDPNHHITTYDYDAWGYLNKVDPPGPTPATTFVNNIMGLPTKKTDAKGNSTDYFYDGAMRVTDVYVDK